MGSIKILVWVSHGLTTVMTVAVEVTAVDIVTAEVTDEVKVVGIVGVFGVVGVFWPFALCHLL